MPNHHYLHMHGEVIPALLEAGVSEGDLEGMFVVYPQRHFEGAAGRFLGRG